jgi:hypothetical protein
MTGVQSQFLVDQAGFGFSHEKRGVRLLDHSFTSEEDVQKWKVRLIDHVRIVPTGDPPGPDTAWSYFQFRDGTAALLRRLGSGHSSGRNDSRALIGSSGSLTVSVALGFACTLGDRLAGGELSRPETARVLVDAESCVFPYDVHECARAWHSFLVPVIAGILGEPGRPLSIIGFPDDTRLIAVGVVRAVVGDQGLERYGVLPFTSFSTYEHSHDTSVEGLPDLIFLNKVPSDPGPVERVVVDVQRDAGQGPHLEEAKRILDRFVARQPASELVPGTTGKPKVDFPRKNDSRPLWESDEGARPNGNGAQSGGEVRVTAQPARSRREDAPQHTTALRSAESLETFLAELGQLRALCRSEQIRQEVRRELDVRALDSLAGFVENDVVRQLDSQVIEIVYGTSLSDVEDGTALKHAAEYLRRGQSEQLTRLLGRAVEKRSPDDARGAVFERWVNEDPFVKPARRRRPSLLTQRANRARYLPLVFVIAVVAVLGVVFLLGVVVGRSPGTQQGAAPAAVPSTTPVPPQPTAPISRSVGGPVPTGYQVFSFVKVGDVYYAQSPCGKAQGGTWLCRWDTTPATPSAVPVALPVPAGQVAALTEQATAHTGVARGSEWGRELNDV